MLGRGWGFWPALLSGCVLTVLLYSGMTWLALRLGYDL
jgi:hypothetical protein